jgi:hypothetical protein
MFPHFAVLVSVAEEEEYPIALKEEDSTTENTQVVAFVVKIFVARHRIDEVKFSLDDTEGKDNNSHVTPKENVGILQDIVKSFIIRAVSCLLDKFMKSSE